MITAGSKVKGSGLGGTPAQSLKIPLLWRVPHGKCCFFLPSPGTGLPGRQAWLVGWLLACLLGWVVGWVWLVWFGLVWFGLVWFGLVWFGLVWFGWVGSWVGGWVCVRLKREDFDLALPGLGPAQ